MSEFNYLPRAILILVDDLDKKIDNSDVGEEPENMQTARNNLFNPK